MAKGGGTVKETALEKELASLTAEKWSRYKTKYVPAENIAIQKATDLPGLRRRALNASAVNYGATFADAQKQLAPSLGARGAAPGSGAFDSAQRTFGLDRAQSMSAGNMGVNSAVNNVYANNLGNILAYGSGQSANAQQGLQSVASASQRQALLDAQAAIQARQAIGQSLAAAGTYGLLNMGGGFQSSPTSDYIVQSTDNYLANYQPSIPQLPLPTINY